MAITDSSGVSHQVVAIGRVFHDNEEIRLKCQEMYPFCDRIIIAEGETGIGIKEKKHRMRQQWVDDLENE